MRITAIAVVGLVAGTLVTASAAQAEVTAQPALGHFYPLQPSVSPSPQSDPSAEVQELRRQISELHGSWDSLTPEQRNQRIAELQQQVTTVDKDIHTLPPDQQKALEATLLPSTIELADLLRKAQSSAPQPCVLFFGPPPCGI
jgi:TolA-binding protein